MSILEQEKYTCSGCGKEQNIVGVIQKEIKYYKFFLDTKQWEDFHGDGGVLSEEYFCLNCENI